MTLDNSIRIFSVGIEPPRIRPEVPHEGLRRRCDRRDRTARRRRARPAGMTSRGSRTPGSALRARAPKRSRCRCSNRRAASAVAGHDAVVNLATNPVADPGRRRKRVGGKRAHPRRRLSQPSMPFRGERAMRSCRNRRSCTASMATPGSTATTPPPNRRTPKLQAARPRRVPPVHRRRPPRRRAALVCSKPPTATTTRRSSAPLGWSSSTSDARMASAHDRRRRRGRRGRAGMEDAPAACTTSSTTNHRGGRWRGAAVGGPAAPHRPAGFGLAGARPVRLRCGASRTPASGRPVGNRARTTRPAIERMAAEVDLEPRRAGARASLWLLAATGGARDLPVAPAVLRRFPSAGSRCRTTGRATSICARLRCDELALAHDARRWPGADAALAAGWLVFSIPRDLPLPAPGPLRDGRPDRQCRVASLGIALAVAALVPPPPGVRPPTARTVVPVNRYLNSRMQSFGTTIFAEMSALALATGRSISDKDS